MYNISSLVCIIYFIYSMFIDKKAEFLQSFNFSYVKRSYKSTHFVRNNEFPLFCFKLIDWCGIVVTPVFDFKLFLTATMGFRQLQKKSPRFVSIIV